MRLWPWIRVLGGLAVLGVLLVQLGSAAFLEGLREIDVPALLAAVGIGVLTTVLSTARWCLVSRRLGRPLPLVPAVGDYYAALFLNAVLPGGVLGDVHRAVRSARGSGDPGRAARAVVLERAAQQVVLVAVGTAVLLTRPWLFPSGVDPVVATVVLAGLGGALAGAVWWARRRPRLRRVLQETVTDVRDGVLAHDAWPGILALSLGALAGYLATFLVAAAAVGVPASPAELLPLLVLALYAMTLPVNVGGFGAREGAAALAFAAAGLDAAQGVSVAVAYGVLALAASLPGAVVLLLRRRAPAAGQR